MSAIYAYRCEVVEVELIYVIVFADFIINKMLH